MPTTITSAGVTFNDTTTLTSANIGTAQLVNGSVTAEKLGTNEQKQICKAWVNFNGVVIQSINSSSGNTISCNSGATTGTWTAIGWAASDVGTIYKITQIGGVAGATFGGVDVSTLGIQIVSVVAGVSATFRFLSGTTTSAQSVTGTGSSASGFSFSTSGIRSSYNVSSVTKSGNGNYTVNFASALADANYSWSGSVDAFGNTTFGAFIGLGPTNTYPIVKTTSSLRVIVQDSNATAIDGSQVSITVFGN